MGGVVGAQAPQSGGQQSSPGTGKFGGIASQGAAGSNPFQQYQGAGVQQASPGNSYYPQTQQQAYQAGAGKYGGMTGQQSVPQGVPPEVSQQYQQQRPFQAQQPNYGALFSSLASMFGGQQSRAPFSNYQPVKSANNFQLRNTYQFDPATDPSRQYAARVKAEAEQKEAEAAAAKAAADAAAQSQTQQTSYEMGSPGNARGGRINGGDKKIRAALLTAKGVQAKAVPGKSEGGDGPHGIDNVHTVIDPATVDHPAADIPGIHLRAGRMGKAGGGALTSGDNFKGWFGSSVAHEDGVPTRFYHGTSKDKDFTSFNMGRHGIWLTADPKEASMYAQENDSQGYVFEGGKFTPTNTASRVMPVYLKAENPYTGERPEHIVNTNNYKKAQSDWFDQLRAAGYDSWIPESANGRLAVALKHPTQIKSAVSNTGKFSSTDKHVGKSGGGPLAAPGAPAPEEEDSITAYHGSPHSFEQFDPAYIGKGEGNQSFGHGLYFAANEGVAKSYRDKLSGGDEDIDVGGHQYSPHSLREYKQNPESLDKDIGLLQDYVDQTLKIYKNPVEAEKYAEGTRKDIERLENLKRHPIPDINAGHMYEVRLKAKPEHFLDWDKPLSDQHPHVIAALQMNRELPRNTGLNTDKTYSKTLGHFVASDTTGKDVVYGNPDAKNLSERLSAAGIRGIRYLDAGSRSQGEGTHNYVVFDPKHIEVKRKYERGGEINAPALPSRVTDRRIPELQDAADMVAAGHMGPEEYHAQVGSLKPVRPYTSLPPMATREDLLRGLSKDKHGKIGAEEAIPEGHAVGLRLDIPAYNKHGVWAPTIHEGHEKNSKPIAHAPFAHVSNPVFSVDAGKALGVARGNEKAPFAKINGFWKKTSPEDAQAMAQEYLNHPEWRQVGMDPERHSFFYDRETRQPVESAEEALQIGPLVLAKNPKYGSMKDFQYENGGRVGYAGGGGEDDPVVQKALGLTQGSMLPPTGSVFNHGDTYVGQNAPTHSEAGSQAGELPFGRSLPGGEGIVPSSHQAPLEGLPSRVKIPSTGEVITAGPNHLVRAVAEKYMRDVGLPYNPPKKYAKVDMARAKRLSDEYDRMADDPNHPLVKAAYDALVRETMAQYQAAKAAGFKAEFWDPEKEKDPYEASPRLVTEDVNKNHHMYVFPTHFGYGSKEILPEDKKRNPLLADSGERWNGHTVTVNDIFRAVHDYFGHAKEGVGFRHDGEENAWRSHASMYSPLARLALTSETRGQNSWVNFGKHGENNRKASSEDTVYAPQKVGIMPAWTAHEGAEDFLSPEDRKAMEKIHTQYRRSFGGRIGYGIGGGEDDPTVQKALNLTQQAQPQQPVSISQLLQGVASPKLAPTFQAENRPSFIVSPRPGKVGGPPVQRELPDQFSNDFMQEREPWSYATPNLLGETQPPPIQHPVFNEPRMKNIINATSKIFKNKEFQNLVKDQTGLEGLRISPTVGTWKNEIEPSFILHHPDMTEEHASKLAHILGFGFQQDAVVHVKHNPNAEEGIPTLLIGSGQKLTPEQIDAIHGESKKHGLDFTVSGDGKAAKFLHFGDEDSLDNFFGRVKNIAEAAGLPEMYHGKTTGDLIYAQAYLNGIFGSPGGEARVQAGSSRSPDLFRRIVNHVLAPYAKAVAGEGYRLSPERLGETYGLNNEEQSHVRSALYPGKKDERTTVPLMTGEEQLDVRPTGNRGRASVGDVLYALQNRAAAKGQIDPGDFSDAAKADIAQNIAKEVAFHVKNSDKSAIGWYDAALKKAMDQYSVRYPELAKDPEKRMLFHALLGITSQGNDVYSNSVHAVRLYDQIQNEGKSLPEAVKHLRGSFGDKTRAIESNLLKFHHIMENNGFDRMKDLFNQSKTVGEWNKILREDKNLRGPGNERLEMEGGAGQKVTGWMMFGPKIGSFINNLHGDYSTLTADLWFSRTWNRLLGHSFIHTPLSEAKQYRDFRDALRAEYYSSNPNVNVSPIPKTEDGKIVRDKNGNLEPWKHGSDATALSKSQFDNTINDPDEMLRFASDVTKRYRDSQFKDKSDLRRRAKNWIENREFPVAAPRGDLERQFQQNTVEDAQKLLKKKYGMDISVADIQAALWFHEKELFGKLGVASEKAQPADYADAARHTLNLVGNNELYRVKSKEKKGMVKTQLAIGGFAKHTYDRSIVDKALQLTRK